MRVKIVCLCEEKYDSFILSNWCEKLGNTDPASNNKISVGGGAPHGFVYSVCLLLIVLVNHVCLFVYTDDRVIVSYVEA